MCSVSGYQYIQAAIEAKVTLHRLMALIYYARTEAIRAGQPVILCKGRDGKICGGDWSDGQIIFINCAKPHILFAAEPVVWGKLSFRGFQSSDFLRFMPDGTTFEQNGSFIYDSNQSARLTWTLIVEKSGRMRVV